MAHALHSKRLSAKQLAMAWLNRTHEEARINPEAEEFKEINGGYDVDPKIAEDAVKHIKEDIADHKGRYQHYVDKYVTPRLENKKGTEANEAPKETQTGPAAANPAAAPTENAETGTSFVEPNPEAAKAAQEGTEAPSSDTNGTAVSANPSADASGAASSGE